MSSVLTELTVGNEEDEKDSKQKVIASPQDRRGGGGYAQGQEGRRGGVARRIRISGLRHVVFLFWNCDGGCFSFAPVPLMHWIRYGRGSIRDQAIPAIIIITILLSDNDNMPAGSTST